jgi:hypothetical protein
MILNLSRNAMNGMQVAFMMYADVVNERGNLNEPTLAEVHCHNVLCVPATE